MSFDIETVLKDMASAAAESSSDRTNEIKQYAKTILENEKNSLKELGQARIKKEISEEVFDREVEREKKVVETELLAIEIMTKAMAQKAVNAAIDVFTKAVKAAIPTI